jgi:hypothetical protein
MLVTEHKWHLSANGYAVSGGWRAKRLYIHQLVLPVPTGYEVDHVNRNKLDNRRTNLRMATRAQNARNRVRSEGARARYRGVQLAPSGKWGAYIRVDGKQKWLGCFDSPEEAARVRDAAAREHYGEFAVLNFPDKGDRSC